MHRARPSHVDRSRWHERWRVVPAVAGCLAYSWWASGTSGRATVLAVACPMVLGAAVAVSSWVREDRVRRRAPRSPRAIRLGGLQRSGVLRWATLAVLLIGWELRELVGSPRIAYPTVTSLVTSMTAARAYEFVAFFVWLMVGSRLREPRTEQTAAP